MSITRALSNAMSGLTATARGTELVSANIANVMTPGYARRELAISPQAMGGNMGGVRIDGVVRVVNLSLLSESRLASAGQGEAATRAAFLSLIENVIGIPGQADGLASRLSDFHSSLVSAAARPDDDLRLQQVLSSATALARAFATTTDALQSARTEADRAIASEIATLNDGLQQVATLNRRISALEATGKDAASLMDERQRVVDRLATIIPLKEVAREGSKIALFTREGLALLDGTQPLQLGFVSSPVIGAQTDVGSPLSLVSVDGTELAPAQMSLLGGGSLAGHFAIRDQIAPTLQRDLDLLALDLLSRLSEATVDPTLGGGAGLFTDAGGVATAAGVTGLAGRITINAAVDPSQGGALWRMRAGMGAPTSGPVSESARLNAMAAALDAVLPAAGGPVTGARASLADRMAEFSAIVTSRRVGSEAELATRNARLNTIGERMLTGSVDSDAEMQKLLQYEQAYAANARVIRALDDMIDQLLRI